jgi:tetratricopeptide (TPR) repeat protein
LAFAYCEEGRLDEGREHFELLASGGFDLPLDWAWSTGVTLLAETCVILRDEERAKILYEQLLPYGRQLVVVGMGQFCLGSVWRSLAILAAATRRWDDAEGHFEKALAVNQHVGAQTFLARTQRAYATMLLDRNQPDDADRAGELIRRALKTSTDLEMALESERLRQLATGADCSGCAQRRRFAHGRRHYR